MSDEIEQAAARLIRCAFAIAIGAAMVSPVAVHAQQPGARSPYDIPFPMTTPPYTWPNEHDEEVECSVTPYQLVDLGTVGTYHIYAGDHCSMPSPDPLSDVYKQVFIHSCDLHDICYFAPGNDKRFCDDMLKWHMDRDCEHAYSNDLGKAECHIAATSWRDGLDAPLSTQYWNRSQEWGNRNCHINRPVAPNPVVTWMKLTNAALPADTVYSGEGNSAAVCHVGYQGGLHPGRVAGSNCTIGYGGREVDIGGGDVLVAKAGKVLWVAVPANAPVPAPSVVGGGEPTRPLFVCRARYENALYAGKVVDGFCNIGYGGRELTLRPFEVLVTR